MHAPSLLSARRPLQSRQRIFGVCARPPCGHQGENPNALVFDEDNFKNNDFAWEVCKKARARFWVFRNLVPNIGWLVGLWDGGLNIEGESVSAEERWLDELK